MLQCCQKITTESLVITFVEEFDTAWLAAQRFGKFTNRKTKMRNHEQLLRLSADRRSCFTNMKHET